MIALYMREAAGAVARQAHQYESYQIDEGAVALLCRVIIQATFGHYGN